MKLLIVLIIALFGKNPIKTLGTVGGVIVVGKSHSQSYSSAGNTGFNSWSVYQTNSPTNTFLNRYNCINVNRDSTNFRTKYIMLDSLYYHDFPVVSTGKIMWSDGRRVKVSQFSSMPLTATQVTTALGFMPFAGLNGVNSVNTRTGDVTILNTDVYSALTYTPYNATNPANYISGINSSNVTAALGYTPYNSTNPNGYISSSNSYTSGEGILITGSQPGQVIAVDTNVAVSGNNAIMYMGKANSAIANLNNGINSKEPSITLGTNTQYWRGDKTWQTLNTSAVPESGNLYYTDIRARGSISLTTTGTSGAATYNPSTGALNIPQYTAFSLPTQTGNGGKALITDGANPSWSNFPGATSFTGYSSGTVYALTTTSQKIDFGTSDPVVTLTSPGTYLLLSNLRLDYSGLTTLVTQTCTFKIRRTNNTAADLSNSSTGFNVPIVTLLTQTAGDVDVPALIYTTVNSNDVIEMWGSRGGSVSVGSINVSEASIVAIKLF